MGGKPVISSGLENSAQDLLYFIGENGSQIPLVKPFELLTSIASPNSVRCFRSQSEAISASSISSRVDVSSAAGS